jgi:hypothetical protein
MADKYLYNPRAIGEEYTAREFATVDGSVVFGHYPVEVSPALLAKLKGNASFASLLDKGAFIVTKGEAGVDVKPAIADDDDL